MSMVPDFESDGSPASVVGGLQVGVLRFLALLALVIVLTLVLSPLVLFWMSPEFKRALDWSETVKNAIESLAVIAGLFAVAKWVNERRDRATDILLKLDAAFNEDQLLAGRKLIETGDISDTPNEPDSTNLDRLLRFYVVLYGVLAARQVSERSLSICFRYWLAHYFRKDRPHFRRYVDDHYPTLKGWLDSDCRRGNPFFRPKQLFAETDHECIADRGKGQ